MILSHPLALLLPLLSVLFSFHCTTAAPPQPVRVADVIGGHVHPSLCSTKTGHLLAVYNKSGGGGKELLLCRSTDGGKSWAGPTVIETIRDCSIYPGSLTRLTDGRILLNWSCYHNKSGKLWRTPHYCLSNDHGKTWSKPRDYPLQNLSNYCCLRHPILELSPTRWVLPLYDRTVQYNPLTNQVSKFSDGRNHGMVPIVRSSHGTIISGAPQANAPVQVGKPGQTAGGLRSTDGGQSWQPMHALGYFGVAGYDLTVLDNGWIVFTRIVYGVGRDGEWSYELVVSRDDGLNWDHQHAVEVYNPGRNIGGRGWPRTVQIDQETIGTLYYDLSAKQQGGPGLFFVRTQLAKLAKPR